LNPVSILPGFLFYLSIYIKNISTMADYSYSSYNFVDNSGFWGAPQQITWHIDRFKDAHVEKMEEQTEMIDQKFTQLMNTMKSIFTGKQEGTGADESYYDMVQRESTETQNLYKNESDESQSKFQNYHNMMKTEMDETQTAIDNNTTRVFGAISANTQSTANAISNQTNSIHNDITGQTRTITGTTYNVRGTI
jgi:hypothetical protein